MILEIKNSVSINKEVEITIANSIFMVIEHLTAPGNNVLINTRGVTINGIVYSWEEINEIEKESWFNSETTFNDWVSQHHIVLKNY